MKEIDFSPRTINDEEIFEHLQAIAKQMREITEKTGVELKIVTFRKAGYEKAGSTSYMGAAYKHIHFAGGKERTYRHQEETDPWYIRFSSMPIGERMIG